MVRKQAGTVVSKIFRTGIASHAFLQVVDYKRHISHRWKLNDRLSACRAIVSGEADPGFWEDCAADSSGAATRAGPPTGPKILLA